MNRTSKLIVIAVIFFAFIIVLQVQYIQDETDNKSKVGADLKKLKEVSKEAHKVSSRSYKGHKSDKDSDNLVSAFNSIAGKRLDDCKTCHKGGEVDMKKVKYLNACNFCHIYFYNNTPPKIIPEGAPRNFTETLNSFGRDYLNAGRSFQALHAIEKLDSDMDGYNNKEEILALRLPGDKNSYPKKPVTPALVMDWEEISKIKKHSQFLLLNTKNHEFDEYALYKGFKVIDLLKKAGADLTNAKGVTLFSADGYTAEYSISEVINPYPQQVYYEGLEKGGKVLGDNGFVKYPNKKVLPLNILNKKPVPGEHWLMIAYEKNDNQMLKQGYLDSKTGKLKGEGPYRGIVPQSGNTRPDRMKGAAVLKDGFDYDDFIDHNTHNCSKSVVAIRVDPVSKEYEEFDWKNEGWAYLDSKQIVIYGAGISSK